MQGVFYYHSLSDFSRGVVQSASIKTFSTKSVTCLWDFKCCCCWIVRLLNMCVCLTLKGVGYQMFKCFIKCWNCCRITIFLLLWECVFWREKNTGQMYPWLRLDFFRPLVEIIMIVFLDFSAWSFPKIPLLFHDDVSRSRPKMLLKSFERTITKLWMIIT